MAHLDPVSNIPCQPSWQTLLTTAKQRLLSLPLAALLILMFDLACPAQAAADLVARGASYIEEGHPEKALDLFSKAVKKNDPAGAFGLGVLYFQGIGVDKDPVKATNWFLFAAKQNYAPAQFNLGNAYLRGRGVPSDKGKAEYWWRQAALQGYQRAQFNLASLLLNERPDPPAKEEGIAWMRAVGLQGAQNAVDLLDELGEPLDYSDIAIDWSREPLRSEARLLTFPPNHYVIQLISARLFKSAVDFINEHDLGGKALLFRFQYKDNSTWIGVTMADYPSKKEALAALETLDEKFKRGAWVRTVKAIQQSIKKARAEAP